MEVDKLPCICGKINKYQICKVVTCRICGQKGNLCYFAWDHWCLSCSLLNKEQRNIIHKMFYKKNMAKA